MESSALSLTSCRHCGTSFEPTSSVQIFCCSGCESVYGWIQNQGLGEYYQMRDAQPPTCAVPARTSGATYDYCDDPEILSKLSPDGIRIRFYLEGLNCAACIWLLEGLPRYCPEVAWARVDMSNSTIEVQRNAGARFSQIASALDRLGYRPHLIRDSSGVEKMRKKELRWDLIRLGIAGALTGNIMILSVSLYGGARGPLADQLAWLMLFLSIPLVTYCAGPFYTSAFASLRMRRLNLDVPIVAALFSGVIASLWSLFRGQTNLYFDSLSMLVFLLLGGRFFLKTLQRKHLDGGHLEEELLFSSVELRDADGRYHKVSSLSLNTGDVIRLSAAETVPIDGFLISDFAEVNRSVLTGESEPVSLRLGDKLEAGCQIFQGEALIRVEKPVHQTRFSQILRQAESLSLAKLQWGGFAERVSQWFIGLVLAAALLLLIVFSFSDMREGVMRAMALIIVTCPCVFGLAIPLTWSLAIRRAATEGILIKNPDALERLWKVRNVCLDKTGTVTTGQMKVVRCTGDQHLISVLLGLEKDQLHPVARALARHFFRRTPISEVSDISTIPGGGMRGHHDGKTYVVKSIESAENSNASGMVTSRIGLFENGKTVLSLDLEDEVRMGSRELVRWLRSKGYRPFLISGDRHSAVAACRKMLDLKPTEVFSSVGPEEKSNIIRKLQEPSLMLGDGVNDALAISAASVGVAAFGSLEFSLHAADVYFIRPQLSLISNLFEIANAAKKTIYRNLFFAASFNAVSACLAITGQMRPLWAAVLMPLSSVVILMSSVWGIGRSEKRAES